MPTYDFRCVDGHATEKRVHGFDVATIDCHCGLTACRDEVPRSSPPATAGIAIQPISQRRIRLDDGFTAIEEVQAAARKAGVDPPDLFAEAKHRAAVIQKYDPEFVTGT